MRQRMPVWRLPRLPPALYCLTAGLLCGLVVMHVKQVQRFEKIAPTAAGYEKAPVFRKPRHLQEHGGTDAAQALGDGGLEGATKVPQHLHFKMQLPAGHQHAEVSMRAGSRVAESDVHLEGRQQSSLPMFGESLDPVFFEDEPDGGADDHDNPNPTSYHPTTMLDLVNARDHAVPKGKVVNNFAHPTSFGSLVKASEGHPVVAATRPRISPETAASNAQRLEDSRSRGIPAELLYFGPLTEAGNDTSIFAPVASEPGQNATGSAKGEGLPPLSEALAMRTALDGVLFVTLTDAAAADFAVNWVEHLEEWGVMNSLVGTLDQDASRQLHKAGIAGFEAFATPELQTILPSGKLLGPEDSNAAGQQKAAVLGLLLSYGLDVVASEVDVVWMHDPTEHLEQYQHVDVLVGSGALTTSLPPGDDGLQVPRQHPSGRLSTGILVLRHGDAASAAMAAWAERLASHPQENESAAFEALAAPPPPAEAQGGGDLSGERSFKGFGGRAAIGILSVSAFANGHTYFVQRLFQKQEIEPFAVHANFAFGSWPAKRHRLREAGLWYDPPEYYETGRYIEIKQLSTPGRPEGIQNWTSTRMAAFHLSTLRTQLNQLRQAMALAAVLQRTLILPKLTCFCDPHWLPLQRCRAPSAADLWVPFSCPLDHVLHIGHFDDSPVTHGPAIDVRERTFLSNSRVPSALKDSTKLLVAGHVTSLVPGSVALESVRHTFPMHASDRQLKRMLAPLASVQVLAFRDVLHAFGGFERPEDAQLFALRLQHLPTTWCCHDDGRAEAYSLLPKETTSVA